MNKTEEVRVDLTMLKQVLETKPKAATWIYKEYEEVLPFGGSLLKKGYICTHCGFFRRKRLGISAYCEACGYQMQEGETNGY